MRHLRDTKSILGVILTAVLFCIAIPAYGQQYGSITYSSDPGGDFSWGISWNYDNHDAARERAMRECRNRGGDSCREIGWFRNTCGAFALTPDGGYGTGFDRNITVAENEALQSCRSAGNANCQIGVSRCLTDGATPSVTGFTAQAPQSADLDREQRRKVQSMLAAQGIDPGPADGVFGEQTLAAIKAWQSAKGYSATGILTDEQARSLFRPEQLSGEGDSNSEPAVRVAQAQIRQGGSELGEPADSSSLGICVRYAEADFVYQAAIQNAEAAYQNIMQKAEAAYQAAIQKAEADNQATNQNLQDIEQDIESTRTTLQRRKTAYEDADRVYDRAYKEAYDKAYKIWRPNRKKAAHEAGEKAGNQAAPRKDVLKVYYDNAKRKYEAANTTGRTGRQNAEAAKQNAEAVKQNAEATYQSVKQKAEAIYQSDIQKMEADRYAANLAVYTENNKIKSQIPELMMKLINRHLERCREELPDLFLDFSGMAAKTEATTMGATAQTDGPSYDETVTWLQETLEHRLVDRSAEIKLSAGVKMEITFFEDEQPVTYPVTFDIRDVEFDVERRTPDQVDAEFVFIMTISCHEDSESCMTFTDYAEEKQTIEDIWRIATKTEKLAQSIMNAFLHLQKLTREKKDLF